MLKFILRRCLEAIPTLFILITISFFMMRLAPGSPFTGERTLPPEVMANIEAKYHLNDPISTQYFNYLKQLAHGDFGPSFKYKDYSVNDLVASSFHFSPGIPILHSKDLVHWRILGHVLERLPFDPAYDMPGPVTLTDATSKPVGKGLRYAGGVWAPAIRHHAGRFYVFWPTPDEGIFMSSAADPAGPWTPPVTVLAGPGYEDPCPFWDDDGRAYLVHSKVGAGPL